MRAAAHGRGLKTAPIGYHQAMHRIPGELGGHVDVDEVVIVVRPSGVRLNSQVIPIERVQGVVIDPPTPRLNGQLAIRYRRRDGYTAVSHPVVFRRGWSAERMNDLAVWLQAVARTNAARVPAGRIPHPTA